VTDRAPVVVGVDFTEASLQVVRWVAQEFEPAAPLVLLHAVQVPMPPRFLRGMYPPLEPIIEDARAGAELRLQELAATLDRPVQHEVRIGKAEDALADVARDAGASVVVIGAHRERSGVWRALGSTVERVVRKMPAAVFMARALPAGPMKRALVAIDDSEMADALLEWAARFAAGDPGRIVLLHVVPGDLAGAVRMGARGREARRGEDSLRRHAELWLRERAEAAGLSESTQIVEMGDAPMQILRVGRRRRVDQIVIGAHGEGHGPFLGSTAEFVLRQGTGSVLVLKAPAATG
jgi:nucleotide-binding universal stress UspA family protein